jgi:hypothetical protein
VHRLRQQLARRRDDGVDGDVGDERRGVRAAPVEAGAPADGARELPRDVRAVRAPYERRAGEMVADPVDPDARHAQRDRGPSPSPASRMPGHGGTTTR